MSTVSESNHRIRLALVGAGVIGTIHGAVISELADRIDLVAVVDLHPDRAERLAAERGGKVFTSLTDALEAVEIDVVSVCTPTGRHGEVAIEALEAGKHVIIEKPAEITVAKTDEIIEAQRKAGTLVAVISQHRFDTVHRDSARRHREGRAGSAHHRHRFDRLVARPDLLRFRRLARHLGARRRRRLDESGRAHRGPAGGDDGSSGRGVRLHGDDRPSTDRGRGRSRGRGPI